MPLVSIVVPCYNEQATIRLLLEALYHQSFSCDQMEVIIADGQSTDRTREEIAAFCRSNPGLEVRLVEIAIFWSQLPIFPPNKKLYDRDAEHHNHTTKLYFRMKHPGLFEACRICC